MTEPKGDAEFAALPADLFTYHLALDASWRRQMSNEFYVPDAFLAEGFIHCTYGAGELIEVANRYYLDDPRVFVALEIDCSRVTSKIDHEDERRMYPHIYGPLNTSAVVRVRSMLRSADGRFIALGEVQSRPEILLR